jgi:trimethylamine corrinoid protein
MDKEKLFQEAANSIIESDEDRAMEIIEEAEEAGMELLELLSKGYAEGMRVLGDQFSTGEVFLAELIFSSEIMKAVSDEIESKMDPGDVKRKGTMVIGTVAGDVHDIGKGIVAALLKANGMEVYDLGREVPAEEFIAKALEVNADIIGSSALLTTTMTEQGRIEELLEKAGKKGSITTMVGGAPVTQRWADKIGADAYCEDASETVRYIIDFYNK